MTQPPATLLGEVPEYERATEGTRRKSRKLVGLQLDEDCSNLFILWWGFCCHFFQSQWRLSGSTLQHSPLNCSQCFRSMKGRDLLFFSKHHHGETLPRNHAKHGVLPCAIAGILWLGQDHTELLRGGQSSTSCNTNSTAYADAYRTGTELGSNTTGNSLVAGKTPQNEPGRKYWSREHLSALGIEAGFTPVSCEESKWESWTL